MSDPAIEAAQRVWTVPRGAWARSHFDPNNRLERNYIAVAREALRPIRELHCRLGIRDEYGQEHSVTGADR